MDRVTVRFLRSNPPFNEGESAGINPELAKALIERGYAVLVVPPDQTPPSARLPEAKVSEERSFRSSYVKK